MMVLRVGDGTVPLAIVIYIDGSFVKHSIPGPVKPIYITLRNLDSVVSGKAMAWRVAGGASAAGPTPDVRHQPPGYPDL